MLQQALAVWPAILTGLAALLGSAGAGSVFTKWLDHKRGMRKDTDDLAVAMVEKQNVRIASLEAKVDLVEKAADHERRLCEIQLAYQRHRINNLSSIFDGLVGMLDLAPERAAEIVAKIKERRVEQEQKEATEWAGVAAAIGASWQEAKGE